MANLVLGYETRTVSALAAELVARAQTAAEVAAIEVEINLKRSANIHSDTGEMRDSVSVVPFGGLSGFGPREVGLIATATAPHAEWVDRGTRSGTAHGGITPVGLRAPYRRNQPPQYMGTVTLVFGPVRGQPATHWFSAPFGRPLGEYMREQVRRAWNRLK